MLFQHIAATALLALCACHGPETFFDKRASDAFKTLIGNNLKAFNASNECVANIFNGAVRYLFKCGHRDSWAEMQTALASTNNLPFKYRDAIAASAIMCYSESAILVNFHQGPFSPHIDDCGWTPEMLLHIVATNLTPDSLYVNGMEKQGLVLDMTGIFDAHVPPEVVRHVLNMVSMLPAGTLKTTGSFAANVVGWYVKRSIVTGETADDVLNALIAINSQQLYTPHTAMQAIYMIDSYGLPPTSIVLATLKHILEKLEGKTASLGLIVPRYAWLEPYVDITSLLFPSFGSEESAKRERVQKAFFGILDLSPEEPLGMQYHFDMMMLLQFDATRVKSVERPQLSEAVGALLDMKHIGTLTVAEAFILAIAERQSVPHAAEILQHIIGHSPEVDLDKMFGGFTIRETIHNIVKRKILVQCANSGTPLGTAFQEASEMTPHQIA